MKKSEEKIFLSKRLKTLAELADGEVVADIGCGHGHLSIYLAFKKKFVYACDCGEKPLKTAKDFAKKYGVFSNVEFILSDGLKGLKKNIDSVIVAGMGGKLIVNILNIKNINYMHSVKFILQPQSFFYYFRYNLYIRGFIIEKEIPIIDKGRIYIIFVARFIGIAKKISLQEALIGKLLYSDIGRNILKKEYLKNISILKGLKKAKKLDYKKIELYEKMCDILKKWG